MRTHTSRFRGPNAHGAAGSEVERKVSPMPPKSVLIKIALFAGIGTGLVCLVDGFMWDFTPFNKYGL